MRPLSWRLVSGVLASAAALMAAGCSAAPPPEQAYVFHPDSSPIKVDTPALRAQKAAAHIAACPKSARVSTAPPGGLPPVTLPCLGGGRDVDLAGLTGKATIVNFWAQSCGPCRQESPLLQRFSEAAGDRVRVIGVDWEDSQPGMAIAFAEALGIRYPQLADPEAATRAPLHLVGLPYTVFVAPNGKVVQDKSGAISSLAQLQGIVSQSLGVHVDVGGTP
jgi:thiol-disulfide isomerase/thioredoxin